MLNQGNPPQRLGYIVVLRSGQTNNNTIRTSNTVLRKICLSLYWKGYVWERVGDRTELQHIDPHSIGHNRVSFPFSWAAQPGARGPSLSGCWFSLPLLSPTRLIPNSWSEAWGLPLLAAGFLYCILSPTCLIPNCSIGDLRGPSAGSWVSRPHLTSKWLNFLCTELYNSSTPTFFLWASQIALIQPIHGQGYTLLFLDRMHL